MNRRAFLSWLALFVYVVSIWYGYDIGHSHGERDGIRWARLQVFGTACFNNGEAWTEIGRTCHTAKAERQ